MKSETTESEHTFIEEGAASEIVEYKTKYATFSLG